jgi:hypothetical protein
MALTPKEIAQLTEEIKKSIQSQQELNELSKNYEKTMEKIREIQAATKLLQDEMVKQRKKETDANQELMNALASGDQARIKAAKKQLDIEREKIRIIDDQIDKNKQIVELLSKQVKTSAKLKSIMNGTLKDVNGIRKGIEGIYKSKLGIQDAFKFSKAIKTSALQMGILSNQSEAFSKDIQAAALDTIQYGVGIEDIAKIQSEYSQELGRTVMLGKDGAKALASMAVSTDLGAEGAAKFAGEMENVGLSAQRTAEYVEQTMNDAHKLGLNSSKIIKNISSNIGLLNRYNFKDGIKGLAKMAETTTKLGLDMSIAAGFADKLFDIEGAVEMSAQLQVLGGEWSKLADPFKLMHMARTDMAGLTKAITDATAASAQFNKQTGEFDIAPLEMQRLRKIAESTGLEFDKLAQSAKNAAKFARIKGQVSINVDKDVMEFISSTATLDEKGQAKIKIGADEKYLSALNASDKSRIEAIATEKKNMVQRAKDAQTLDELLGNTITMGKQLLIPLVEALNNKLKPSLDALITKLKDPKFIDGILKLSESIGNFIAGVGNFIIKFPLLTAGLFVLFEAGKWFLNGIALGKGFNTVAGKGGAGGVGGGGGMLGGLGKGLGTRLGGGLGGAAIGGVNAMFADSVGEGIGNVAGGAIGGILGSFLGPVGTMIGGQLGASIGGAIGSSFSNAKNKTNGPTQVNDGIIQFNDKDKFIKVNDGTMIAGTEIGGNKKLANAIQEGTIPKLNKEPLLNSMGDRNSRNYSSGVIQSNVPGSVTIEFGELKITGSIDLKMGNVTNPDFGKELINNPSFIRQITTMVNTEAAKAISGINQQRVAR